MSAIPATAIIMPAREPVYNGVKIRVNNPTITTSGEKNTPGNYNAVDIEVNNPKVNNIDKSIYQYPNANGIVTYDQTGLTPISLPHMPVTPVVYTSIHDNMLISAGSAKKQMAHEEKNEAQVPAPNVTSTEAEKNLSFHGTDDVEIVPSADIKPEVDINTVIAKLNDKNFDVQAIQLEQIARTALQNPVEAIPYVVTDVYTGLIDIMSADTSNLEKPTDKQIEARRKIIINEIVKEQAAAAGANPNAIELPYKLTKEEMADAVKLSPFEMAERNKEYAILTTALLTKIYINENKRELGAVPPLTDLPGVSDIVDVLRHSKNDDLKMTAIDSLMYIKQPEYKEELKAIFELAATDANPLVARNAVAAAEALDR